MNKEDPATSEFMERTANELHRLKVGHGDRRPEGLIAEFVAQCNGDSEEVCARAKEVLVAVDACVLEHRAKDDVWRSVLPAWFVAQCSAEPSERGDKTMFAKRFWRRKPSIKSHDAAWSVLNWVGHFSPELRSWYWWDTITMSPDVLLVQVEVDGFPFGSGNLSWLLRASGARTFDEK